MCKASGEVTGGRPCAVQTEDSQEISAPSPASLPPHRTPPRAAVSASSSRKSSKGRGRGAEGGGRLPFRTERPPHARRAMPSAASTTVAAFPGTPSTMSLAVMTGASTDGAAAVDKAFAIAAVPPLLMRRLLRRAPAVCCCKAAAGGGCSGARGPSAPSNARSANPTLCSLFVLETGGRREEVRESVGRPHIASASRARRVPSRAH